MLKHDIKNNDITSDNLQKLNTFVSSEIQDTQTLYSRMLNTRGGPLINFSNFFRPPPPPRTLLRPPLPPLINFPF